jgi:hypothetical protein
MVAQQVPGALVLVQAVVVVGLMVDRLQSVSTHRALQAETGATEQEARVMESVGY